MYYETIDQLIKVLNIQKLYHVTSHLCYIFIFNYVIFVIYVTDCLKKLIKNMVF